MKRKIYLLLLLSLVLLSCTVRKGNYSSRVYKNPKTEHRYPTYTKSGPNSNNFFNHK